MTVDVSESQTQLSETNKLLNFWTELYYWFTNLPLFIFGQKWKYCLISWANILGTMNLNLKFWIFDQKLATFKLFTNGQRFISLFITFCCVLSFSILLLFTGSMSTRSDSPSVSPAPSSTDVVGRCRALYDYHNANMEESQIPMHAGEEFLLIGKSNF